jgi:hypothetical protein
LPVTFGYSESIKVDERLVPAEFKMGSAGSAWVPSLDEYSVSAQMFMRAKAMVRFEHGEILLRKF